VGVVDVVIGVLLIRHPIGGVLAAGLLIGIWLIAIGVIGVIGSFGSDHGVWHVVLALLQTAAGIVLVSSPPISFATLALLVGISFIVRGVSQFALGWLLHGVNEEEGSAYGAGAPA
jgi:uncharacterized membrane protein HdeD (DUF308 family)